MNRIIIGWVLLAIGLPLGPKIAFAYDWSALDIDPQVARSFSSEELVSRILEHPRIVDLLAFSDRLTWYNEFATRFTALNELSARADALIAISNNLGMLDLAAFRSFKEEAEAYAREQRMGERGIAAARETAKWMFLEGLIVWIESQHRREYVGGKQLLERLYLSYPQRSLSMKETINESFEAAIRICGCEPPILVAEEDAYSPIRTTKLIECAEACLGGRE